MTFFCFAEWLIIVVVESLVEVKLNLQSIEVRERERKKERQRLCLVAEKIQEEDALQAVCLNQTFEQTQN